MSVSEDADITCAVQNSAIVATLSYAHTVDAGANKLLVVTVAVPDNVAISTVTFDGVAMTQAVAYNPDLSTCRFLYVYTLANPTVGTKNVVVTLAGNGRFTTVARSFSGAHQAQPLRAHNEALADTQNGVSVAVASDPSDLVLDVVLMGGSTSGLTPNAAGMVQECATAVAASQGGAARNTGAASVTMAWKHSSGGATRNWGIIAASVQAAAAVSAGMNPSFDGYMHGPGGLLSYPGLS